MVGPHLFCAICFFFLVNYPVVRRKFRPLRELVTVAESKTSLLVIYPCVFFGQNLSTENLLDDYWMMEIGKKKKKKFKQPTYLKKDRQPKLGSYHSLRSAVCNVADAAFSSNIQLDSLCLA